MLCVLGNVCLKIYPQITFHPSYLSPAPERNCKDDHAIFICAAFFSQCNGHLKLCQAMFLRVLYEYRTHTVLAKI